MASVQGRVYNSQVNNQGSTVGSSTGRVSTGEDSFGGSAVGPMLPEQIGGSTVGSSTGRVSTGEDSGGSVAVGSAGEASAVGFAGHATGVSQPSGGHPSVGSVLDLLPDISELEKPSGGHPSVGSVLDLLPDISELEKAMQEMPSCKICNFILRPTSKDDGIESYPFLGFTGYILTDHEEFICESCRSKFQSYSSTSGNQQELRQVSEGQDALGSPAQDKKHKAPCKHWIRSGSCNFENCKFAHGEELAAKKYKTEICTNWKKGKCTHDDVCWFAHGFHELNRR